jgi:hypothetical protein
MEYSCFVCVLEKRRVCFGVRVLNEWLCVRAVLGTRLGVLGRESCIFAVWRASCCRCEFLSDVIVDVSLCLGVVIRTGIVAVD